MSKVTGRGGRAKLNIWEHFFDSGEKANKAHKKAYCIYELNHHKKTLRDADEKAVKDHILENVRNKELLHVDGAWQA